VRNNGQEISWLRETNWFGQILYAVIGMSCYIAIGFTVSFATLFAFVWAFHPINRDVGLWVGLFGFFVGMFGAISFEERRRIFERRLRFLSHWFPNRAKG